MGGSLWATAVHDWEAGKMSYYGLKDKVDRSKEDRVFDLVSNLHKSGKRIDVFYEAGRYGYWPARKLMALGAHVHILPINKLQVIMSGKTIKTDKLDAKFLAGLHPSDHVPTVYIPTLEEEGRRDAEREWNRIKESIGRVNAQMIALIERTPLPGFRSHRTACEWQKAIRKWSKLPEWAECPCLLLLRLPNLLAELEMFEKELATWKQTIQKFQDLQSGKILEFEKLKPGILKNRNYAFNDPDALERETNYFVGMFERVYMSLRFLKSLPQWDRKNLAVVGTSQGGAQAIAGGGLESAVTCVVAHVPALGDHGANFAGRDNGWPKFTHQKIVKAQPDGIQKMLRAVDYVDTAFFAARINPEAALFVSTGLFDNSAHSSSLAAEFNSFRGKNKEFVIVQSGHRIPEKVNTAGLRFLKNNTKITKE